MPSSHGTLGNLLRQITFAGVAISLIAPLCSHAETLGFSVNDSQAMTGPRLESREGAYFPANLLASWLRGSGGFHPFGGLFQGRDSTAGLNVTVLDDDTLLPIQGAGIQISDRMSDLTAAAAADDLAQTGADGTATFRDNGSDQPLAVTVTKAGYASVTLLGVVTRNAIIYLKRNSQPTGAILNGTMGNFQVPDGSDLVYGGLVFRTISAFDLLHFDMSSVISPLKDTIDVMGQHEIPSNLVLPRQSIPVFFASIDLDKPQYRLPVVVPDAGGAPIRLAGLQCQISTDDVISIATGGGTLSPSMINKVHFTHVGISQAVQPASGSPQDVPAPYDLQATHQVMVPSAPFQADVLVAAFTDLDGNRQTLLPTDITSPRSGSSSVYLQSTASALGAARGVVAVALAPQASRLSGVVDMSGGSAIQLNDFLNIDPLQDYQGLPPSVPIHANPKSVAVVAFEGRAQDSAGVSRTYPIWTVYALPAAGNTAIPTAPLTGSSAPASYSEMQLEFSSLNEHAVDGLTIIRDLTRFARSTARARGQ